MVFVDKIFSKKNLRQYRFFLEKQYSSPGRGTDDFTSNAELMLSSAIKSISSMLILDQDVEVFFLPTLGFMAQRLFKVGNNIQVVLIDENVKTLLYQHLSQLERQVLIIDGNAVLSGSCISLIICKKNIFASLNRPFLGGGSVRNLSINKEFCLKSNYEGFWSGTWPVVQIELFVQALQVKVK